MRCDRILCKYHWSEGCWHQSYWVIYLPFRLTDWRDLTTADTLLYCLLVCSPARWGTHTLLTIHTEAAHGNCDQLNLSVWEMTRGDGCCGGVGGLHYRCRAASYSTYRQQRSTIYPDLLVPCHQIQILFIIKQEILINSS